MAPMLTDPRRDREADPERPGPAARSDGTSRPIDAPHRRPLRPVQLTDTRRAGRQDRAMASDAVTPPGPASPTPFVGRADELSVLGRLFDLASSGTPTTVL